MSSFLMDEVVVGGFQFIMFFQAPKSHQENMNGDDLLRAGGKAGRLIQFVIDFQSVFVDWF